MRPHPSADSKGFVLISVVIFVLIITLIGLSIFSLGGYETSFFGQDVNHSSSYLAAKGGLVRASFILESVDPVNNDTKRVAQTSLTPGVARVVLWQNHGAGAADTIGSVDFYPTAQLAANHPVRIDVTGQVGNSQRTLSELFYPVNIGSQSSNLLSIAGGLTVGLDGDVALDGPVRQSSND